MHRMTWRGLALVAATLVAAATAAAGDPGPQSSSQAGVTVSVTPRDLDKPIWAFEVAFNTHSQELKDDLAKSAVLIADGGAKRAPTAWQGDPPGGHHRKGVLTFAAVTPMPARIELQIQRPGEPAPRILRWQLR